MTTVLTAAAVTMVLLAAPMFFLGQETSGRNMEDLGTELSAKPQQAEADVAQRERGVAWKRLRTHDGCPTVTGEALTITSAGARLRTGELTCVELATSQLERIAALDRGCTPSSR